MDHRTPMPNSVTTADPEAKVSHELDRWRSNLGQSEMPLTGPRSDGWWTGLNPNSGNCPGQDTEGFLHSLPQISMASADRASVQAYFDNSWLLTESLFAGLVSEEAFYRPPYHSLRHPLIFYYVHPAVLYVNKLVLAGLAPRGVNPQFEALFETGVDEMRWDDMSKNSMSWPSIDEAHAYRKTVYELVRSVISSHPGLAAGHQPITKHEPLWSLFMGLEHERIHLETSGVLIRELPLALVQRPQHFPPLHPSATRNQPKSSTPTTDPFLHIDGGAVRIGKSDEDPLYGWDNEYGDRTVQVAPFAAQEHLVTNAEYLHFVVAGGYRDNTWWSEDGTKWRGFRHAKAPTFWRSVGPQGTHKYKLRTLFEEIAMQDDWPAVVNGHEAEAYARWQSKQMGAHLRLPSEAEQHRLRAVAGKSEAANLNLKWSSESPVGMGKLSDVTGNVWQWCADDFHPLQGFRIHDYYDDFSTPCFDGEHQMILGGSFLSTGGEAAPGARFHFRPHFFQHAGIRLVKTEEANDGLAVRIKPKQTPASYYESDQLFNEYMLLHYATPQDLMPHGFGPREACDFPRRTAELGLNWAAKLGLDVKRALDVGCAVGGATFRFAQSVKEEAIGIDLSERFIAAAKELQEKSRYTYFRKDEGDLGAWLEAKIESETIRDKATFLRGDACSLPPDLGEFDIVLLANLLCRIPSPRSCLKRMSGERGLVRPGGLLVLTTPFTWAEVYTPKDAWLGGKEVAHAKKWSADGLIELLEPHFELLEKASMPLVIREHSRKFQYIVPDAVVFRRKS